MPEEVKNNNHDFILFDSQTEYVDLMTDAQAGQLMKALYHHNRGLEVTFTDPLVQMAFMVLWQSIENSRAKRDKLRENASKGGNAKRDNQQAPSNGVANSSKGVANSSKQEQAPSNGVASTEQNDALNISVGVGVFNTPLSSNEDIPPRGETAKAKKETIAQVIDEQADILRAPLIEFVEHRKRLRKGLTPHALRLCIQKLESLAPGNLDRQKYLVEYAIMSGWQTFFEPKEDKPRSSQQGYLTEAERRQAHNDAVCRQVAAELEAADSPF